MKHSVISINAKPIPDPSSRISKDLLNFMFYVGLSYGYQVKQDGSNSNPRIDSTNSSRAEE